MVQPDYTQTTIGQRLKFLMESIGLKVRTFAQALEVSETNIRNYISRDSKPSSDVIERIVRKYPQVNPAWLITGDGEPYLLQTGQSAQIGTTLVRNNSGQAIGVNHGTATQNHITLDDCKKDLATARKEIALLNSQLADKERTIQILLDKGGK